MSGIVGHVTYALLAAREAEARGLAVAPLLRRHRASYLCGCYLGCDIQSLPEAVCLDTGQEVGYGTVPVAESPLTGGPVKPWKLAVGGHEYTARDIHARFYGRSHLVFGWSREEQYLQEPWDHLREYFRWAGEDALALFEPGERALAFLLGMLTHVVGDSLIKSVHPGLALHLLDGKYTPRNRPIQDLVSFHEVGRKELKVDWRGLLNEIASAPVEPVQAHFMRIGSRRGSLGQMVPGGWRPDQASLLQAVVAKNRRYLSLLNAATLREMELEETAQGVDCCAKLREVTGLHYGEMVELAGKARFREALQTIARAIVEQFPTEDEIPCLRRYN